MQIRLATPCPKAPREIHAPLTAGCPCVCVLAYVPIVSTQPGATTAIEPEDTVAVRPAGYVDYIAINAYVRHDPASWSHLFFLLALCYDAGLGVTPNPSHAYRLFALAIGEGGNHDAAEEQYDAGRPCPADGAPRLADPPSPPRHCRRTTRPPRGCTS